MMQKILLTGSSGFLGWYVAKDLLSNGYEVIGTYSSHKPKIEGMTTLQIDLTDSKAVVDLFQSWQPKAVIHLAANSNANQCELKPEATQLINVMATTQMAQLCAANNIPFLFTSTDLIFDGQHAPYDETVDPNPINTYGQQKKQAEQAILDVHPTATIARSPLMYGLHQPSNNFLKNWIGKLQNGETIAAFKDELRTPASGNDVSKGIRLLLEQQLPGIWHLGGPERISRYDFALEMAEVFNLPKTHIKASLQADVQMPAARPSDVSMNSQKTFKMGYQPLGIRAGLLRELHKS